MEKKDCEAAHQTEMEQLRAAHNDALTQKEASHIADLERLEKLHLDEKAQQDAALKDTHAQLAKETEVAQAVWGEVTRLAQERLVRDREALEEAGEVNIFLDRKPSLPCVLFQRFSFPFLSRHAPTPAPHNSS